LYVILRLEIFVSRKMIMADFAAREVLLRLRLVAATIAATDGAGVELQITEDGDLAVQVDDMLQATGFKVNLRGWEYINPADRTGWEQYWQFCDESAPKPLEIVVTKTRSGRMAYDWLQQCGEKLMYCQEGGEPQFWMPKDTFEAVAPKWARERAAPLSEGAITELERLQLGLTGDA
jgi:hypothetical protein